jgi:hypothetical protein
MSRRAAAPSRTILPDPKFNSDMLAKFMNVVMHSGKKSAAEHILYGAIERITEKTGRKSSEALELLSQALDNVKPVVEVKSRRARSQREVDGVPPGARAARCGRESRRRRAQAGRHAPHGGGQQGLRALSLVVGKGSWSRSWPA